MIIRVIVLIAVVLAVLYLIDAWKRLQSSKKGSDAHGGNAGEGEQARLISCARCGVHIPAPRALWAIDSGGRKAFCSSDCRNRSAEQ